jgi:hypothetical protein
VVASTTNQLPDYYAVLQVHPDADDEVIAAAYRQLMKKYHPDVAGEDPVRVAEHAARSKALNAAFGVLRDPHLRRQYDSARIFYGTQPAPRSSSTTEAPQPSPWTAPPSRGTTIPDYRAEAVTYEGENVGPRVLAPLGFIAAAYYLLPGTYEWEDGRLEELLPVLLFPLVATAGFALVTGRLAGWIGRSPVSVLGAAVVLLLLSIPMLRSLPRVALAAGPTALLLSGVPATALQQNHIPPSVAWLLAGATSLVLSARLYIFGVLPTLAACWLLTCLG